MHFAAAGTNGSRCERFEIPDLDTSPDLPELPDDGYACLERPDASEPIVGFFNSSGVATAILGPKAPRLLVGEMFGRIESLRGSGGGSAVTVSTTGRFFVVFARRHAPKSLSFRTSRARGTCEVRWRALEPIGACTYVTSTHG